MCPLRVRKEKHVRSPLERRGLLGAGAATLAVLGQGPVVTEGKKGKRKKKGAKGFSKLQRGEETQFSVGDGAEDAGESLCPNGTRAINGAFFLGNTACAITEFSPIDGGLTGWQLRVRCPTGEESEINGVVAICIS
jgi:hypothetical protein